MLFLRRNGIAVLRVSRDAADRALRFYRNLMPDIDWTLTPISS